MPEAAALVAPLLGWFARNARDLPWRRTTDPYAIWVSEVMLQQTQVATVIPYWDRWLEAFPNIRSLAVAPVDRVLKLWEGLGYYSRARNLQRAAQQLLERHDGKVPEDFAAVLALPGIGRYTAGALGSLAFNQAVPVLDGNVIRVLARVLGVRADVARTAVRERLWRKAGELVLLAGAARLSRGVTGRLRPHTRRVRTHPCGALNEALMELGALVCTPRSPRCGECPWAGPCVARARGWTGKLPRKGAATRTRARRMLAFWCCRGNDVLVWQRPAGGVNAGLWELPGEEAAPDSAPLAVAQNRLGADVVAVAPVMSFRHAITSSRIQLEVYSVIPAPGGRLDPGAGRWVAREALGTLAFSAAHRRVLNHLEAGTRD
jgi:A/G-specific adenine glycosylase